MKPNSVLRLSPALLVTLASWIFHSVVFAQTATWTAGAGDSDWNNALNWDIGVPAEGTNAIIASGTVNYNAPMTATSFGFLSGAPVLNINASGFVSAAAGDGAIGISGSASRLF